MSGDDKSLDIKEEKKDCKCPDYVLRAQKSYYSKNKNDPNFLEKRREHARKYREENYEMLLERDRIRMRNKRAAAKNAKLAQGVVNQDIKNETEISLQPVLPGQSIVKVDSVESDLVNKIGELVVD